MTSNAQVKSYSMRSGILEGTTGTGLDQIIDYIALDPGLAGANTAGQIEGGAAAAIRMNEIIVEAATAVGAVGAGDAVFTTADVLNINAYIRANHLAEWTALHGDDENGEETGFHLVQNDGATLKYDGQNAVNTVFDGIYHLGFEVQNGRFLNEDGDANATVEQVASWLTQFYTDHSTTPALTVDGSGETLLDTTPPTLTGMGRIVDTIMADGGLQGRISESQIEAGADAANGLNKLILDAVQEMGLLNDHRITVEDVLAIENHIQSDPVLYARFLELHGDDENGTETGYHLVQNDGGNTSLFGRNAINTVFDAIYHIGFDTTTDGDGNLRFVNEDGNQNEKVSDVANWIDFFASDVSDTGTGLDTIVDTLKLDKGLTRGTDAGDIMEGARAANDLNHLLLEGLQAVGALQDGWISEQDLVKLNAWVKADETRHSDFVNLHGDDEDGEETGFHNVQNDGATTQYFGENLVNTVADGIYHFGFDIETDGSGNLRFLNEDGDENQTLTDVSAWLNYFLEGKTIIEGTDGSDDIAGTDASEQILASGGDDWIDAGGNDDLIYGSWGNDTVLGGAGNDTIIAGSGDDYVDGGEGSDTYQVSGNQEGGWSSFQDFDTYGDSGTTGVDTIKAVGDGQVDIGVDDFNAQSGIEVIDGTGAGSVHVVGTWRDNVLDFSTTTFVGGNIAIDGGSGNDVITGTSGDDTVIGGGGEDQVDGGAGSDTYLVTGNEDEGWCSFQGYDTYTDTGASGVDTIKAVGDGDVDIGFTGFGTKSGIERIDATGAAGTVRLLGDWRGNRLDFSAVTLVGSNIVIDGGDGNDTVIGTAAGDVITGGRGDDNLNGGNGSDTYIVSGNEDEGWCSFQGYDTYTDKGTTGTDTIRAVGEGNVDIGLRSFGPTSGIEVIDASGAAGTVTLLGDWQNNRLDFSTVTLVGSNIAIDGGDGNDTITGTSGADLITGGRGDDNLNGGNGGDTYLVTGNAAEGWCSFQGYDTYSDKGTTGTDTIKAVGAGNVDIGLKSFGPTSGIEVIDATAAAGTVTLLGDWQNNRLDFTGVTFVGSNIVIDGGDGNDTVTGTAGNDVIVGNRGDDNLNGAEGSDRYVVTGNEAGGWSSFSGYDTYTDKGLTGSDTIAAVGAGAVDIGLRSFGPTSGIEVIDATGAAGLVTLKGDWQNNKLDFSGVTILGSNVVIDAGGGNDVITGSVGNDVILSNTGDDAMNGGNGSDTYIVTGNEALGWSSFTGYDTYTDKGTTGTDTIRAVGTGDVDIGLRAFNASGIEVIDGTGATGLVTLMGDWQANTFDFSNVTFVGTNFVIEGGGGNDTIKGNAQANVIIGGDGNDILTGGAGADTFVFDRYWSTDRITDFAAGADKIALVSSVFTALTNGVLSAASFYTGIAAHDADDRIVYNATTGKLYYDADGNGSGSAVQIGLLTSNLQLTSNDFTVI